MHCLAGDVLGTYDHKLFQARKLWEKKTIQATALQEEPLQLEGEEVALIAADSEVRGRAASEAERVLKIIQRMLTAENTRSHGAHEGLLQHAERMSLRSQKLKQELALLYILHRRLKDHISARDELDMCFHRVQLASEEQEAAEGPRKQSENDQQYARRLRKQVPPALKDFMVMSWESGKRLAEYETRRQEAFCEMQTHDRRLAFLSNLQLAKQKAAKVAAKAQRRRDQKAAVDALPDGGDKAMRLGLIEEAESAAERAADKCPICLGVLPEEVVMLGACHHTFCKSCLDRILPAGSHRQRLDCPMCRSSNKLDQVIHVGGAHKDGHSTKIAKLLALLQPIAAKGAKSLVFSQWSEMLEIVARALEESGIPYLRLGQGGPLAAGRVIEHFKQSREKRVLLLPVKTGSNGLNLCEATHVFLLEPLLNPGLEKQAINRVHRIGQDKPTEVHRLVCRNTAEETIHALAKRRMHSEGMASPLKTKGDKELLTLRDFRALLQQR